MTACLPTLTIPRLRSGSVSGSGCGPGRCSVGAPPPRLERAVLVHECLQDVGYQWPQLDRFAVHVAVVVRVGSERLIELAGYSPRELYRRKNPDSLELHSWLASLYGPGKMTSC